MSTPAQGLPPWEQAKQQLPPWEQAKQQLPPWEQAKQQLPPWEQAKQNTVTSAPAASAPPPPDPHPWLHAAEGWGNSLLRGAGNVGAGALKGAGQTLGALDDTSVGRFINSYGGLRSPAAVKAETDSYRNLVTPHGVAQNIGAGLEQAGEVALLGPDELGMDALKGAPRVLGRLAASSAVGAGDSRLHGGSALAGAIGGGIAEGAGAGLRKLAPTLAEAGIGARAVDREYGKTPGLALLNDTRGLRPATVAKTARDSIGRLNDDIERMAADASVPTVEPTTAPTRLALPPGPAVAEALPLHDATAVVERPADLQPAAEHRFGAPVLLRQPQIEISVERDPATGRMVRVSKTIDPGTNVPNRPVYSTSPASSLIPADPTWRLAPQQNAADFLDRLDAEGGNGVTYPYGQMKEGAVAHPLREPLRTTRRLEPAQGIWLRTPEGPIPINAPPATPENVGFTLRQPTVSLRPALARLDDTIGRVPENSPSELKSLQRVRGGLTEDMNGAAIPQDVSPSRALALKRGLRKEFGKYRGDSTFDANVASNASKAAARDVDAELDRALGPEFASKNQRISSLIDVKKLASRAARNARLGQRVAGRLAAHTGALTGAGVGSVLGYEKGGFRGAAGGALAGLLLPEMMASRPALIGAARAANSPFTARVLRGALVPAATALTQNGTPLKGVGRLDLGTITRK